MGSTYGLPGIVARTTSGKGAPGLVGVDVLPSAEVQRPLRKYQRLPMAHVQLVERPGGVVMGGVILVRPAGLTSQTSTARRVGISQGRRVRPAAAHD